MATQRYRPTSPGRRGQMKNDFDGLTRQVPEKKLTREVRKSGGRDNYGHATLRYRGGGHRRRYRYIDFRRDKRDVPAKVATIEYDPNRTARIALLHYLDGDKRYILAPIGVAVGDKIQAGESVDFRPGNAMPLKNIPLGAQIHNIELKIGKGGQLVRSAGGMAQLLAKEGDYAQVRLPSGEVRKIHIHCYASIGQLGNSEQINVWIGKAGRMRWLGRRPKVRGVAKNPVDHPMGGGEGKTSGGRHPCSPWGWKTKGLKTRWNPRTDKFIIKRRRK